MEVDRVGKGLKGKDPKGKGKGSKGKDGKGKGKWNNNSKGKGDWNKDSKGKGKGGKDKSGGKAQWPQVCGWCQKPGHYKCDCFQYKAYMEGRQKGARQVSICKRSNSSNRQRAQLEARVQFVVFGLSRLSSIFRRWTIPFRMSPRYA